MPWIQLYCNLFLAHSAAEQDMIYLLLTALLSLTSSGIVLSQSKLATCNNILLLWLIVNNVL